MSAAPAEPAPSPNHSGLWPNQHLALAEETKQKVFHLVPEQHGGRSLVLTWREESEQSESWMLNH